ncbi:MAG: diphthine--ammonia ligase [Eubacteriaceae bacterium]|nr:diphthine--ammonia ligase [Eubacteriaceae bacterium]
MRFAMSYSCGKDSTLALHKMISEGNECVALIIVINRAQGRSFFHGISTDLLRKYEKCLGLPVIECPSVGDDYHLAIEEGFRKAGDMGAEAIVFGDIDIQGNREWSEERCRSVGLPAVFPLWHADRKKNVSEVMDAGYTCIIKTINNTLLPEELLGKAISPETVAVMEERGIDICGENGEYHTFTADGPIFITPLEYEAGEILRFGDFSVIDIN